MEEYENDPNFGYFEPFDELSRLRYLVAKYKEHDKKRTRYMNHLERINETYRNKIKEYEKLTERQHDEIDELIAAYDRAKPLIANPDQKAYVYELLERIKELKPYKAEYGRIAKRAESQEARIAELEEMVKALKENIKRLHKIQNGNK